MRQELAAAAIVVLILAVAVLLRFPQLGDRPFHGDEAVHALKFRELWERGRYEYDPDEYHGPTIYYAALPVVAARGRTSFAETRESDYRLAIALIGTAMLLLYPLLRDALGAAGCLWAALLTAVSSPFVFYSRYFIQEMALAAFTLALIAFGWRYYVSRRLPWLIAASVSAGLVVATKETSLLTFAALTVACLVSLRLRPTPTSTQPPAIPDPSPDTQNETHPTRRPRSQPSAPAHSAFRTPHSALATTVALAVAFTLLSGFFSHPEGPLGYLQTYTPWLRRAAGTDLHRHPPHYYLALLGWQHPKGGPVWTELFILGLAAIGGLAAFSRDWLDRVGADPRFARFALIYGLVLCVGYSLIPYKTPWNLLSFHLGFILLAGLGAAAILATHRALPPRVPTALLLAAGAGHLAWQAGRTTVRYRDDNTGPYAYAQPLRGVREIEQRVNELAAFSADRDRTVAQVVFTDAYYWPLPWYLRRLRQVGYWTGAVPEEAEARLKGTPIVLSSAEFDEALTERLGDTHFMIGFHSLRPGVLVQMWVKNELWEPFVMSRSRKERAPDGK